MARGDGRSPSRAEYRRDDHRDIHRKRPRSRSADHRSKRERDHHREPYRRRSRSPAEIRDRRDDDRSRNDYRDRPRDRAANGYERDHRRRSPERGERQDRYRDDRPRRSDEYADSHRSRRDDPRESKTSFRSAAASQPSEEQIKAERQAKAAAWKAKKESKAKGGPVDAVRGIDARDPGSASPRSPSLSTTGTAIASMPSPDTRSVQTKGFEGKFDPNEIVKKASTSTNASKTLDAGFNVPITAANTRANLPGQSRPQGSGKFANVMAHTTKPKIPLKAKVFDLGKKQGSTNDVDVSSKLAMDFDDEQTTRKKFKKLDSPEPELGAVDVAMDDDDDEGEDDVEGDGNMSGSDNEGDVMSAARAAAQKRSEQMMRNQNEDAADAEEDVKMPDAAPAPIVPDDPLDAFMQDLEGKAPKPEDVGDPLAPEREAIFNEDDHGWDQADEDDPLETRKSKKKKDLPIVDHSKIKYEPFRKSFFTAPAEIAEMTEDEVGALRYELDDIKLHGKDVPRPVTKWAQCGLGSQSLDIISRLGFERPTPIQAQAIPAIMSGRDIIGVATTGSGKTVAFLLPMFRHIKDQKPLEQLDGPVGLVLAPTRELATQIHRECRPWLKSLGLRAVCAYGGAPIKDQIAELKRGAEIVVCTPGRMVDLLFANGGRVTNLRRVTYVVLDEADRMFDMGFEPQIKRITANIRPDRQMVLFSATFPKKMESLARNELKNPCEIQVGGISVVAPEVEQIVEVREESSKFARLLKYLGDIHEDDDARSLVFVNTQEVAEDLASDILKKGYPCNTIHGGRDQFDRDSTISDFKAGIFPVLVATSVAARGLDVKQLKLVVNFDCPNHPEDYVHRCGRTGRAGNKGMAVTFLSPEQDRFAELISKALRRSGLSVPDDLQKLVDGYAEKVKAGTAKHMGSTSGFKGKGLERLEKDREVARSRQRKAFGDDDDEEEEKKEEKKDTKKEEIPEVKPAAAAAPAALSGVPAGIDLDNIKVFKSEAASGASTQDRMKGVSDAAAAINARLKKSGDIRGSAPIDNKGPDAGAFHSHIEINDFPQKARWAVTNRSNVSKILETTGTSITNKGNFYPPGQNPGPNDAPKLAILVEGDTELAVSSAMNQITRLLKEGLAAAADSEARAPTGGRYTVV